MVAREIKVINTLGVHARPASKIVQTANRFKSAVSLCRDKVTADAKSILNVMMLGANYDTSVTIRAAGEDEKEAVDAIAGLFEQKFNEE
jgi:phosphotransferase system HPr (HPr) family protein